MTTTTNRIQLGDTTYTVEPPVGRKATRVLALLRKLSAIKPQIDTALAEYRTAYERENVTEYDRVQAKLRYPPRPAIDDDSQPITDEAGNLVMVPSPVDRLTEDDWTFADQKYRVPRSPGQMELGLVIFTTVGEHAEDLVAELLALCTLSNAAVKKARADGNLDDVIEERADLLLDDGDLGDLLELAVIVSEVVDRQITGKLDTLGERLGKAARRFGLEVPTRTTSATTTPSNSTPTSSTDSALPTDGHPTPPSTPGTTSSSTSPSDSSTTADASTSSSTETPPA